jgi:putative ATPase
LLLAKTCFESVNMIGWPESRIILSQTVIYLASSPKSNASYEAINRAQEVVKQSGDLPVPLYLRNAPTRLMKDLDYGKDYQYAHAFEGNFADQEYFPKSLEKTVLYTPGKNPAEQKLRDYLKQLWKDKYGY